MRFLYRSLLRLHPASFRDQFAAEMLWIFDQAPGGFAGALLADGLVSLVRQWVLRAGVWKIAASSLSSFALITAMLAMAAFPAHHSLTPDFPDFDLPATASRGPSTQFAGHWAGNILFPGPAGQIEFTLAESDGLWTGELQVRGLDGAVHPGLPENIRVGTNSLSFRFKTNRGDMIYRGRMIQGKLRGYVRPAATF
jgi:hypothetical protein